MGKGLDFPLAHYYPYTTSVCVHAYRSGESIKMIINDNNKFIFVHIPKNSGTAMSDVICKEYPNSILLKEVDTKTGLDKMHLHQDVISQYINQDKLDTYFIFCIIRNPYEKMYSAWSFIKNRFPYKNVNDFIKFHITNEFIFGRELIKNDARVHYRPQHTFIFNEKSEKMVNFIIRYETLNNDIKIMNEFHNLNIKEYGKNHTRQKHIRKLNSESILKINDLYDEDFRLLSYNKINPVV